MDSRRIKITGRVVAVPGNDIDTDRIIPARFLKCVVFDGLGEHVFADDRAQLKAAGKMHPFDDPRFADAEILLVNKNFGCGSSREHAPQAIMRWGRGIKAIVGESFAEIFFGNCVSLGIPCLTVDEAGARALMEAHQTDPAAVATIDIEALEVALGSARVAAKLPDGPRRQFLDGSWDTTAELLAAGDEIRATAARLPYFEHWRAA